MLKFALSSGKRVVFGSFYRKLLVSFVLFASIPILLISWITFTNYTNSYINQIYASNIKLLKQVNYSINSIASDINRSIFLIFNNNSFDYFINNNILGNPDKYIELYDCISSIQNSNSVIDSIYVVSEKTKRVLISYGGFYTFDDFYDNGWQSDYSNIDSPYKWIQTRPVESKDRNLKGFYKNVFSYIRPVNNALGEKMGAIIVNINQQSIQSILDSMSSFNKSSIFITNSNYYIISHDNKDFLYRNISSESYIKQISADKNEGAFISEIDGVNCVITYISSDFFGWKFIARTPVSEVSSYSNIIRNILIAVCLFLFFLSVIISLLFGRRIYNPIKDLVGLIKKADRSIIKEAVNEFALIKNTFNRIMQENEQIEVSIQNNHKMLNDAFFNSMINGYNFSPGEMESQKRLLKIDFPYPCFCGFVIKADNDYFSQDYSNEDISLWKFTISNIGEKVMRDRYYGIPFETSTGDIVLVYNFDLPSDHIHKIGMCSLADRIREFSGKCLPFSVSVGIGNPYHTLQGIANSYTEACFALSCGMLLGNNMTIHIEDVDISKCNLYKFPAELDSKLASFLRVGDISAVYSILDMVIDDMKHNYMLDYEHTRIAFIKILSCAVNVIKSTGVSIETITGDKDSLYEGLSKNKTFDDMYLYLKNFFELITCYFRNKNSEDKSVNQHIHDTVSFMENNYHKELLLNDIAHSIKVSPQYLSKIFKDQMDDNAMNYLNRIRINKSLNFLRNDKLSIRQIAQKVGFNNDLSFTRRFKKYMGITPGQYRTVVLAEIKN